LNVDHRFEFTGTVEFCCFISDFFALSNGVLIMYIDLLGRRFGSLLLFIYLNTLPH